ncbi:MAG TPA: hypothetical protein VH560_05750 [Polyangia bacterium]|jgi:hypothetical protein|nr:hypothetical protein [Polyangia bacterium]
MRTANGLWHHKHPLSTRPSFDERVRWHLFHARACGCRAVPKHVAATLRERGIELPTRGKA